ncbi:hypothetical protein [Planctomycetes bacterium Poly30]|uniref:hypothetical protein n=1 Tax=Saltatorellus ferox TaxID=2528018 RepID=UPI00119F7F17
MIVRIRRALERYDLDPIALGLPPCPGDEAPGEFADSSGSEHPLLDFGYARDGSFFPDVKVASVKSASPFAPGKRRPLERLLAAVQYRYPATPGTSASRRDFRQPMGSSARS